MWESFYPPMDWEANKATWPHASHSHFIQISGQTWHVQVMGNGPPLLLLHGTGASTHSWRDLMLPLAREFTVVVPDLPGHAFTTLHPDKSPSLSNVTEGLHELLLHLKLWPQAILGHSAGAAVGAQLILNAPALATPVLIGLNPAWLPLPGLANWLFPPAAKLLALSPFSAHLFAHQAKKSSAVRKLMDSTGSRLDDLALSYYQRLLQSPTHVKGVLSLMAAWNLDDLALRLKHLSGPVFLHLGGNDRTVPLSMSRDACGLIPRALAITVPDLGHLAHEEAPEATTEQITAWIRQSGA
jgi:magnesium chelatase accessory protein